MAFKGTSVSFPFWDTTPIKQLLLFTNIAEGSETKPRHHVMRIGVTITILADECGADDVEEYLRALSKEEELLNWQPGTNDLQDDVQLRNNLTEISGKLCPKPISQSLFAQVTDRDTHQQMPEASSCRHVIFRSAMLTQHSASGGQVQLLYSHDGLRDRSCMRWRSHDFIKLLLPEGRSFKVFWLIHWDVVDMTDRIGDQHVVTGCEHVNQRPSSLESPTSQPQSTSKQKLPPGVRLDLKRKSPYIAEVRPKGVKDKLWLGTYQSAEAAARAVDAGNFYYNPQKSYNFPDSPLHLQLDPPVLDGKLMKKFVKDEAQRLALLAEDPAARLIRNRPSQNTSYTTSKQSWDVGSIQESCWKCMQLVQSANLVQDLPRLDGPQLNSSSDSDVWPPTPYGGVFGQEPGGSSSSEYLRVEPIEESEEAEPNSGWIQWIQTFLDQIDSPSR